MNRRLVLGSLVFLVVAAGCLGSGAPPSEDVVSFHELPSEAQTEFTTALEQGGIHECDVALLDVEKPLVEYEGSYYSVAVSQGDGTEDDPCGDYFVQVEKVDLSS
ncbi:hypothetical protein [Haloferax sp. DFSO60]|uniref:hypothetical protein n=1 Tax=Haloferax sp. DFSO60 TaxID=3388652 RepID=UPI00397C3799